MLDWQVFEGAGLKGDSCHLRLYQTLYLLCVCVACQLLENLENMENITSISPTLFFG